MANLRRLLCFVCGLIGVVEVDPCAALVEVPYTRETFPVQCRPDNCYYVDGVNGSDSNDGTTLQSAWRTLQRAVNGIQGGATVLVASGVYTNEGALNVFSVGKLKSGTPVSWTTFAALPGQKPVIQVSRGSWSGIAVGNAHHILIDGFEIAGRAQSMTIQDASAFDASTPAENCIGIGGGDLPQARDVIVRNSILHDCPGAGIIHFAADSVFILYNHIYNNGWYNVDGGTGLNLVHQADSPGNVDINGYRSYVVGNLLERNRNYLPWIGAAPPNVGLICEGNAIIIDANKHTQPGIGPADITGVPYTGRTYIANNIIRDTGGHAIVVHVSARVDVANNTTYNDLLTDSCGLVGEISIYQSDDVNVVNNVAINLNGKSALSADAANLDYNLWTGGRLGQAQLGPHDIEDAPVLTAPALGDFSPSPLSPAVVAGSYVLAPSVDFFGNPRPPSRVDRGAIQVSAAPVVEYFHDEFNHYFVTGIAEEISKLDTGIFVGWQRTGQNFEAYTIHASGTANVCRFFSTGFEPKSSHFYTPNAAECGTVKQSPHWQFEGEVFSLMLPDSAAACTPGTQPLYRVYNNGQGGAPNHRYTTSSSTRVAMLARGWVAEGAGATGVIGCVPVRNFAITNRLVIGLAGYVKDVENPSVSIMLNGTIAVPPTLVTATKAGQAQTLKIDTTPYEPVMTMMINVLPIANQNYPARFANVQLQSITYQGSTIPFSAGQYNPPGSMPLNGGATALINPGSNVIFGAPALPRAPPSP